MAMRLEEFDKPDYKNMSDEELDRRLQQALNHLEETIDRSNNRIENELRRKDTGNLHKISIV